MDNNKLQYHFGLLVIWLCINNGMTVNYNSYATSQQHLLDENTNINDATINMYHKQQQNANAAQYFAQNLQGYYANNQQQLYGYYYSPPSYQQQQQEQQQQQHSQTHQQSTIPSGYQPTTQLWSGLPIVVEEDIDNQQPSLSSTSTGVNQPTASTAFYKQQEIPNNSDITILNRDSNKQTTAKATQFNYNNNNNIIYHRDFRPQIAVIPDREQQIQQHDDSTTRYNTRQQQQQQRERQLHFQMEEEYRKQQEQQQQQFNAINTNLRFNGISNDLRKDNTPDYREHFLRYLENNPLRIKPIY